MRDKDNQHSGADVVGSLNKNCVIIVCLTYKKKKKLSRSFEYVGKHKL